MNIAIRLLSFVSLALIAQQAFAVTPTIQHIPVDATFPDSSCGFLISVHEVGTLVEMSYTDAQGVFHLHAAFPTGIAVFTNVATGKSVTTNQGGGFEFTVNPDGSFVQTFTGHTVASPDPDTQLPGLFLINGRVVFSVDANGVFTSRSTGLKTSVCALVE